MCVHVCVTQAEYVLRGQRMDVAATLKKTRFDWRYKYRKLHEKGSTEEECEKECQVVYIERGGEAETSSELMYMII